MERNVLVSRDAVVQLVQITEFNRRFKCLKKTSKSAGHFKIVFHLAENKEPATSLQKDTSVIVRGIKTRRSRFGPFLFNHFFNLVFERL